MIIINGISGELYHYKIVNSNMIYEKFISASIPSIFWPNHSQSTPLQYNSQSKKFSIQLSKPRLGEHIYYERFIYLLRHGLNLLSNKGFSLMYEELNKQTNLTEEAITYIESHVNFYQHIHTPGDLIIFLNWYATEEITKQLEILLRKLTAQAKLSSSIYKTLVMPNNLISRQVQETLIIEIPLGRLSNLNNVTYSSQNKHP